MQQLQQLKSRQCNSYLLLNMEVVTSISPSCGREANLMLFCAYKMSSFSKTYHISHIFGGAHRPRPFLPHDFSKDFQDCILNPRFLTQRCAFSNNPRHMLPHPFCGSALHSGHCPWHSMAFLGETWRRNMQTVPPHAPHHRIKYQT